MSLVETISFDQPLTTDHIRRLCAAPHTTKITLWSAQQLGAIEHLMNQGLLSGDPRFAYAPSPHDGLQRGKRCAYAWMQKQMKKRVHKYRHELPVWTLLTRPPHTKKGGDKLLKVEVPKSRVLISFHRPWCQILEIMDILGRKKIWPDRWIFPDCPYVPQGLTDKNNNVFLNESQARRSEWDEAVCRQSWENIFDLSLSFSEEFLWWEGGHIVLQGVTPYILKSEIVDVLPIDMYRQ